MLSTERCSNYSEQQIKEIESDIKAGMTEEQAFYCQRPCYTFPQRCQIRLAFSQKLTKNQIALLDNTDFSGDQMYQIRTGLVGGIPIEKVRIYAD